MINNAEKTAEQAMAFQKMWMDSASKMMQAAFTVTPGSASPELVRQMRGGIFQALTESWDEFMRSPQFLEGSKQWMDNAITFRKMTNEFMAKMRNEMQAPSRDDIDNVMLNVRHMEKRLLDRLEELSDQLEALNGKLGNGITTAPKARAAKAGNGTAQSARRETIPNTRTESL
jgi:hypothetical protein